MKTKNIFRMFLLAATLLLGVNQIKADIIWEDGPNGNFTVAKEAFANAIDGSTLKVYTTDGNQLYIGSGGQALFYSPYNDWIRSGEYYNSTDKCFEFTLTEDMVNLLKDNGLTLQNYSNNITKVVLEGTGSGDTPVIPKYTLTYSVDGTAIKTERLEEGDTPNPPADPTKDDYIFAGWQNLPKTMPAEDITVIAQFDIKKYKVRYYIDNVLADSAEYAPEETIVAKEKPSKTGYTFNGWYGYPESMTMPKYDVAVTGSFTINNYSVVYNNAEGNYFAGYYNVPYGTTILPDYVPENTPTKTGYLFDHWEGLPETMPDSNLVVNPVFVVDPDYEDPKYALIYYIDNVPYDTVYYEEGATVTAIADPTRKGYTFNGWQNVPTTMPAYTVNAYGSFTKITFAVTYKIGDDVLRVDSVNTGDPIVPPTVEQREHYTFAWGYYPQTMGNQDVLVTGTYTAIPTHDLIYYVDGQEYKRFTIEEGAAITPEAEPERRGFTFSGWSTIPTAMPNYDYGVYGSFSATIIDTYPIYYQVDGYTIYTERLAEGETPNPPATASKTGYTFIKWSGVPETMPAEAVTVTAQFSVNSYTLTYTLDGEAYGEPETIEYGAPITAKANPADREGYTFSGWLNLPTTMPAQNVTVSGTFYKDKEFINISVGTTGYNTFSAPYPVKFQGTESIKAYIATAKSDTEVTLTRVIGNIAAGTGLVLIGEAGATAQIETAETGSSYSNNLLVGVTNSPAIINAANLYVLVNKSGTVKFADTAGNAATVPVGKAYLEASAGARILSIFFDEDATGLSGIAVQENWNDQPVYDLRGQRVTTPKKGLYMINGKKVFVK